jgi:hypothetical protein
MALAASGDRLYPISTHDGYGFHAGMTGDNRQVLMGLLCPNLVAFFFDMEGNLLDVQERLLTFLQPSGVFVDGELIEGLVRRYDIYDERIPPALEAWQKEIGFQPTVIRVKKFFVGGTGIQEQPEHFAEILVDPDATEEEKRSVHASLEEWEADGQFVLWWGSDYWLNGTGEVSSS